LVFVVGILSFSSITQLEDDTDMVAHTQKVIKTSDNLLQQLIDAETAMRGYGATGKQVFLEPYNTATPNIHLALEDMRSLITDNPLQVKRVGALTELINSQLNVLKTNIETRTTKGLEYMVANNLFVAGKQNMDSIRQVLSQVKDTENQLLAERKAVHSNRLQMLSYLSELAVPYFW